MPNSCRFQACALTIHFSMMLLIDIYKLPLPPPPLEHLFYLMLVPTYFIRLECISLISKLSVRQPDCDLSRCLHPLIKSYFLPLSDQPSLRDVVQRSFVKVGSRYKGAILSHMAKYHDICWVRLFIKLSIECPLLIVGKPWSKWYYPVICRRWSIYLSFYPYFCLLP